MTSTVEFKNYDDPTVYQEVQKHLLDINTKNFAVEFGQNEARIALNLGPDAFGDLLSDNRPARDTKHRPVRWM